MCYTIFKEHQKKVLHWFPSNDLVANAEKCHLLTAPKTPVDIHVSNTEILNEETVKLLGVKVEGRLNFDFQVNTLLGRASKKYRTFAKLCNYINKKKRRILINISVFLLPSCLNVL